MLVMLTHTVDLYEISLHLSLTRKGGAFELELNGKTIKNKNKKFTYLVAVRASSSTFRIRMDTYVIYILSSISFLPQLSNNFIYFLHFHCVEAHKCSEKDVDEEIIIIITLSMFIREL